MRATHTHALTEFERCGGGAARRIEFVGEKPCGRATIKSFYRESLQIQAYVYLFYHDVSRSLIEQAGRLVGKKSFHMAFDKNYLEYFSFAYLYASLRRCDMRTAVEVTRMERNVRSASWIPLVFPF